MNESITQEPRDYRFVTGLLAGTVVGAGLMIWLAPRMVSEIRERMTGTARSIGQRAAEGYERTTARAGEALDEVARKGQDVRDDVADVVARGARKVERFATAAKSDRITDGARTPADHHASPSHSG